MRLHFFLFLVFRQALTQTNPTNDNPPHNCENFGLCASNPSPTSYNYSCPAGNCVCQPGTTGPLCQTFINSCASNPCSTNGQWSCTNTASGYSCACDPGYTGSNCNIPLTSPCAAAPCLNGGTCNSPDNVTYTCNCPSGYLAPNCEYQNPCTGSASTFCQNGATCVPVYNGANVVCKCRTGYYDRQCSSFIYKWVPNTQQLQGCYQYGSILEDSSKYYKITSNQMTYSMCQNLMETTVAVPPYTMFTVMQQNCYLSTANYLNATQVNWPQCNSNCPGDNSQTCGSNSNNGYNGNNGSSSNWVVLWTIDNQTSLVPQMCSTYSTVYCLNNTGHGMCISMPNNSTYPGGYICICAPPYIQITNRTACGFNNVCSPNPCLGGGTCSPNADGSSYTCACPPTRVGQNCSVVSGCDPNPCQYGSTCTANSDGTFTCNCLKWYSGNTCGDINTCDYANPCVNGTCKNNGTGIEIWPWCQCNPGYTGQDCDQMINYCTVYYPCQYNATCTPGFLSYSCACIPGTSGKNCSTIINNCVPYTDPTTGQTYPTRCNTKDSNAVCVNAINAFSCSAQWTDQYCDLNVIIENVMIEIYGSFQPTLLPLLNELMTTPAMIADMVPFIIGTLTPEQRSNLSWSLSDMFYWATFEEKELDLTRDFVQWNDVVLGNCFTFNHYNSTQLYDVRSSKYEGGLRVKLKVNQAEYEPWTDTAAMLVFIHYRSDYIMSESVRYNAEPSNEVIFFPYSSYYTRLGGSYGTCINSVSQVKAFYFPGDYTTDGCLRSCYQDMVMKACQCMDPRYPIPAGTPSCVMANMTCIDDASAAAGDPSTWPTCVCPLPCSNTDFGITWSKSSYREETANCLDPSSYTWDQACQNATDDSVIVQVTIPEVTYSAFAETGTMDFNHLIGNLGALLGVLMGICAITFIEIAVMIFRVVPTLFCYKKK